MSHIPVMSKCMYIYIMHMYIYIYSLIYKNIEFNLHVHIIYVYYIYIYIICPKYQQQMLRTTSNCENTEFLQKNSPERLSE